MARKASTPITFILHNPKATSETPIYGVIRFNNERVKVATGFKVFPKDWDGPKFNKEGKLIANGKQRVKNVIAATEKDKINEFLNSLEAFVASTLTDWKSKRLPITKEAFKKAVDNWRNPDKKSETTETALFTFIRSFIEKAPERRNHQTQRKVSKRTIQKYNTVLSVLKEFEAIQNKKGKRIDFDTVNLDFYHDFTNYLENEKNYSLNNVGKYIQTLKVFLNEATFDGINTKEDFKSPRFKVKSEESDSVYLNEEELRQIFELDLTDNTALERVRDLFLVGAYTGLRFSDLTSLGPNQIKNGRITIEQAKTGGKVVIPCLPVVVAILDKYEGNLPPSITNQKMNDYLKVICKQAGIDSIETKAITKGGKRITKTCEKWEMITTHTARRSFATNMYKMMVPALTIMAITGHKTEKSFRKYIKVTNEEQATILETVYNNREERTPVFRKVV